MSKDISINNQWNHGIKKCTACSTTRTNIETALSYDPHKQQIHVSSWSKRMIDYNDRINAVSLILSIRN